MLPSPQVTGTLVSLAAPNYAEPRPTGQISAQRSCQKDYVSGTIGRPLCRVTDERRNVIDHGGRSPVPRPQRGQGEVSYRACCAGRPLSFANVHVRQIGLLVEVGNAVE